MDLANPNHDWIVEKISLSDTREQEHHWAEVLHHALFSLRGEDIDYPALRQIFLASSTPAQFSNSVRLISQHCRSHPGGKGIFQRWIQAANESTFSLTEWIEALEGFSLWLSQRGHRIDLSNMLRYLECCTQLPDSRNTHAPLGDVLHLAIEKYGVAWCQA